MINIKCPICETELKVEEWAYGNCPTCNNEYWFDENCAEDYSDCYVTIEWKKYE